MKKILLLSAVLLGVGAATASHAGVRFSIGIPLPPPVIVTPPPVYTQPPQVYVQPPQVYAPAPPPVVVAPPVLDFSFGTPRPYYRPYHPYYYNRGPSYWHHDRDDHRW